jgi:hypothetical protein
MIPFCPHRTAPAEHAVDGFRHADRESLASASQAVPALGFDQQVNVVGLYAEVQEPKRPSARSRERIPEGAEHPARPQRRKARDRTQGDMDRLVTIVRRSAAVGHASATWSGRPTCTRAPAAPGTKGELGLARLVHLETGRDYTKLAGLSTLR